MLDVVLPNILITLGGRIITNLKRFSFNGLCVCLLGLTGCSDSARQTLEASATLGRGSGGVIDRLSERSTPRLSDGATAPSLIVDPTWPKPLPNNWRIGQIGGIAVDSHDNIWVYHRPRALGSSSAGAMPRAGTNDEGVPISAIGHPRPYADRNLSLIHI